VGRVVDAAGEVGAIRVWHAVRTYIERSERIVPLTAAASAT
jgi:hypothetical protein